MLGKLIKQEIKITSRTILPMYLCFIVTTLLLKLSTVISVGHYYFDLFQVVTGLLYVVLLLGVFLLTYFVIVKRFYNGVFGDEGYLMFTLPVKPGQILNSKLITSFFWLLLSAPLVLVSFFILLGNTDLYRELLSLLSVISEEIAILEMSGFSTGLFLAEIILSGILKMVSSLLCFYLAITLGHHFFGEHRLLGTLGCLIGIGILESTVETFLQGFIANMDSINAMTELYMNFSSYFLCSILLSLFTAILYYGITHYFLNHKLNLN